MFQLLAGAHTNDAIQEIEREISPLSAEHWNKICLNGRLFTASTRCTGSATELGLTAEQMRVLERYHAAFKRAGAALDAAAKARLAEISERLATLGTAFSQNVLADEQAWHAGAGDRGRSRRPAGFRARGAARRRPRSAGLPAST